MFSAVIYIAADNAKEIIGSAAGGTVLHKDIVRQNAKPGDYSMVFRGKKLDTPPYLNQGDINYRIARAEKCDTL
ncbi:hypothetical protein FACS1894200_03680 [Spirochaetia bacterium]|nr:hypothetical protein FACS1894200_03680 [Spirochaetia bacterium]